MYLSALLGVGQLAKRKIFALAFHLQLATVAIRSARGDAVAV